MRSYEKQSDNKLEKVICNRCGREMKVVGGILQEGVFEASVLWGYFSDRNDIPSICVRLVMRK